MPTQAVESEYSACRHDLSVKGFGHGAGIGADHAQHTGHATHNRSRKLRAQNGPLWNTTAKDLSHTLVDDDAGNLRLKNAPSHLE